MSQIIPTQVARFGKTPGAASVVPGNSFAAHYIIAAMIHFSDMPRRPRIMTTA
jgi:hypothetical protein